MNDDDDDKKIKMHLAMLASSNRRWRGKWKLDEEWWWYIYNGDADDDWEKYFSQIINYKSPDNPNCFGLRIIIKTIMKTMIMMVMMTMKMTVAMKMTMAMTIQLAEADRKLGHSAHHAVSLCC